MIYQLVRLLKVSRRIILAMIFLFVILHTPKVIVKNGTQRYGEDLSSKFDELISHSNITSKKWACIKKLEMNGLNRFPPFRFLTHLTSFSTLQSSKYICEGKIGAKTTALLRKGYYFEIKSSCDKIFSQDSECLPGVDFESKKYSSYNKIHSNFMPWTKKSLKKTSILSFWHVVACVPFTRFWLDYNDHDNIMIRFNIMRNVQLLKDFSNTNRYLYHNKLISHSFISYNLKSNTSSTSANLLQKKKNPRNFYQACCFYHIPIRTKAEIMRKYLRELHLVLKIPMGNNRTLAGLSVHSNNARKKLYKRQLSNHSNCKSLLGDNPQTCKKDRKASIIFYILLSFAGACCIMLGGVQFWNHKTQSVSKLTSPRNKIEKKKDKIPSTLHQYEMSSSPIRELNIFSQNPVRDERNSELENALRVDGANDTLSFPVPKQKITSKQKYATFPLCAAKSRNLAPTLPELQLPKPSLVSIRRLTGFSSDASSNSDSCADQNPKNSTRF
ncbi:hypothetical protein GcM1_237103 [Golovinomyces cichoracearum]|uniref:Uncharacterized protein n=1 Tax=Golovinomyces cichoracearum TaxID=62708 RepID=A0A420IK20_9PEZI|nr:hypothetical protein GcM1_237103 [Golovinomyces cichoracearum]